MLEQILRYKDNPKEDFPDTSEFVWDDKDRVWYGKPEYIVAFREERVSFGNSRWDSSEVTILDGFYPYWFEEDGKIYKAWYCDKTGTQYAAPESKGWIGDGVVIYWEKME